MIIDPRQHYEQPTLAVGYQVWVDIRAPIKLVFDCLTKAEALTRWWSTGCQSDPAPGGHLQFQWNGEHGETTGDAIFRRFDPPNFLTWEWTYRNQKPIQCDGTDHRGMRWPAYCEFELATLTSGYTRVHLHDWGINGESSYQAVRHATKEGWVLAMQRLKRLCEMAYQKRQARRIRNQQVQVKEPLPEMRNEPVQEVRNEPLPSSQEDTI